MSALFSPSLAAFAALTALVLNSGFILADEYQAEASLRPRRAFAPDGSYVEVTNDREHIRAARFDAQGIALGNSILVDRREKTETSERPELKNHSVAMDGSGNFLVAWEAAGEVHQIHFRLFSEDGSMIAEYNSANRLRPAISMGAGGRFLLTYKDFLSHGRIVGELFDANGRRTTEQFFVSTDSKRPWGSASAIATDGRMVVAFEERDIDATRIRATVLSADDGMQSLFEVPVSGDRKAHAQNPSVAIGPNGEIAVVWEEISVTKIEGDLELDREEVRKNVLLAVVDENGRAIRAAAPVNSTVLRFRDPNPTVSFDDHGRVVITYSAHAGELVRSSPTAL